LKPDRFVNVELSAFVGGCHDNLASRKLTVVIATALPLVPVQLSV